MWQILKHIVRTGIVTEPEPGVEHADRANIERIQRDILEVLGQAPESGAEHDPDLRHQRRTGADGGLERVETRGLIGRGDGQRRIDHVGAVTDAGLQNFVQGSTAGGPRLLRARREYRHRDAGHVPSSLPGTAQERRRDRVQKRPKRPALAGGPLM